MTIIHLIFYAFATVAVASGVMVVAAKNSIHSVLFLVLAFFAMAGVWVLLNAEFLALILVLVYVGAVMTLFLFVIMMLNVDHQSQRESFVRYLPFAALILLLIVGLTIMVLGPERFGLMRVPSPAPYPADYSNTADLGSVLYTVYAYPFEIAGALLLAGIIAAITLSHRKPKKRKVQNIADQIARRPEDSMRILNLRSENKTPSTGLRDNNP
jgi:NADH-quinone oxidoreductase subunit J